MIIQLLFSTIPYQMNTSSEVFPGSVLAHSLNSKSGRNTYRSNGCIISTINGTLDVEKSSGTLSVIPLQGNDKNEGRPLYNIVPSPGHEVEGRIQKVTSTSAFVEITYVQGKKLQYTLIGSLRFDEIRLTSHRSPMIDFFRPGDKIRAEILSTADSRCYVLSAFRTHQGVIEATSQMGFPLKAIEGSHLAMKCTGTHDIEKRLVASEIKKA